MLLLPFLDDHRGLSFFLFLAIPFAGVYASAYNKRALIIAVILCAPAVVTGADQNLGTAIFQGWLARLSAAAFYGFTAATMLAFVLREKKITANTIYGALSVYLLLGMTWAFAYSAVEHLTPGAFYVDPSYDADGALGRIDFFYYSFVTLTTLGYGDILPISTHARTLAILEAVCGVLYTAALVASLVGRLGAHSAKS